MRPADEVQEASDNRNTSPESMTTAHGHLERILIDEDVMQQLKAWEAEKSSNAMFRSMMNYVHRVEAILFFVEASRNADLNLHLQAGEALSKLFFALDRIKYKRLWPRYNADMHDDLKAEDQPPRDLARTSRRQCICHQE